jgi:hypothetical protein
VIANGVNLDTLAYNVASRTGRMTTPPRKGKNLDVPGRDGAIFTPGKRHAGNTVILPLWVVGANEDGEIPAYGNSRELCLDNLDRLRRLFTADTVTLVDEAPDGTRRTITGQVLDVIDPTSQAGGTRATFSVSLICAAAYWEDVDSLTASKTGTGVWDVAAFEGATARMSDLTVRFDGICTNPRLTSPSGIYVAYNAVLTGTQWVSINCGTWAITTGGGLTVSYQPGTGLDHGGDPRWFVLEPGDPTPRCTFSQTAGATGTARLTGRRKYAGA